MPYDWKKMDVVPRNSLEAWHHYDPAAGLSANNLITDASGNNRNVTCAAGNAPILTANLLNGQSGWYFNGSRDPLAFTGSLTTRHAFVVASYEDATFPDYKGLLSGVAVGDIFTGNNSGDIFFDFLLSDDEYRKADVIYASNNQKAPMSGSYAVLEFAIPSSMPLDGIQIGQQRAIAPARKWKGWFIESLIYSQIKTALERARIYEYFAMRYRLWPTVASGLNVFPFPANRTRSSERDRENYLSEPYTGDPKALVRGNFKGAFQLPYALRIQPEYEAAEAFHAQHYPTTKFVFRDYRYYPEKDVICRMASPIREQGSDVTYRFNYSFDAIEAS